MKFDTKNQISAKNVVRDTFPKIFGVYAFINNTNGKIDYIGSSTGKNGLRNRIWNQHLNPIYLENREKVFSKKDGQQIKKGITHNGKLVIEKSVFRKKVARDKNLAPGRECLNYIFKTYRITFILLEDKTKEEVITIEEELIDKYSPIYN